MVSARMTAIIQKLLQQCVPAGRQPGARAGRPARAPPAPLQRRAPAPAPPAPPAAAPPARRVACDCLFVCRLCQLVRRSSARPTSTSRGCTCMSIASFAPGHATMKLKRMQTATAYSASTCPGNASSQRHLLCARPVDCPGMGQTPAAGSRPHHMQVVLLCPPLMYTACEIVCVSHRYFELVHISSSHRLQACVRGRSEAQLFF